jgi:hypothetical protein
MVQLSLTQNPRTNQDKRIGIAYHIYDSFKSGNYLIHKTTRAGCTTALVAESMNRNEKFLCVVPTNWIADKTVVTDSKKYSDMDIAEVIHIPANHECEYNKELCKEYPDLKKLPILPLAGSCTNCQNFNICEVTSILRKPKAQGVVITYKKLSALMMAAGSIPNTMAEKILTELNKSKNLILDEVHEVQYGDYIKIDVYDDILGNLINIKKFHGITTEYKYLRRVINEFSELIKNKTIKNSILEVLGGAQDTEFWKHHLNKSFKNPSKGIGEGESEYKVTVGSYNELVKLTKYRESYNLEMKDILELFAMMSIIMSKITSISAIRDKGVIKIGLAAVNDSYIKMIQSFVMSMQKEDKRTFLTSATICSYDYGNMFMGGVKPKNISFGTGGDPMSTNSKMLLLTDSKKYSDIGRNSRYNKRDEIINKIIHILNLYEDSDCLIIALNRMEAINIETALKDAEHPHEVTYYKASEMMGVSAKERVMIAVGIANKPSNSFDVITTNTEESKVLLWESIHCDTWQAWSRVKDPQGKTPSLVFALGCTVEECTGLTTWGYNRKMKINPYVERQKKQISVNCDKGLITRPFIIKCKNFKEMIKEATMHKLSKVLPEYIENLPIGNNCRNNLPDSEQISLLYYNIRRFLVKTGKSLHSSTDLVKMVINRPDAYAAQKADGSYLKVKKTVTDNDIKKHLDGKVTIGAYQFNPDNQVKWICFDIDSHAPRNGIETAEEITTRNDIAEKNTEKMCNFLTNNEIPFMLEKSGSPHSYHIWIFINPVDGKIANKFALDIKKESGIDCEVFPKQATVGKDGYGNLVKVPLATHQKHKLKSMIQVNGEFVSSFVGLDVEVLDISKYPLPEPEVKVIKTIKTLGINAPSVFRSKVRPCIENALKMQLTKFGGNQFRVSIVREYYNSGIRDPEKLVDLFRGQSDFIYEKTKYHVTQIIKKEMPNVRCDTLQEQAGMYLDCTKCTLVKWHSLTEIEAI